MGSGHRFGRGLAGKAGLILACLFLVLPLAARAEEAIERELLHPEAVFVLEVQKPLEWAKHPTLNRVWQALSNTRQAKHALETPEFQRVLAAKEFLESASGEAWDKALSELTAGGVWVGVTPKPNERATLIIAAAHAEAWTKLESSLLSTLKMLGQETPPTETYQGIKTYKVENSRIAVVGHRLIAASHEADLKRMVDELLKQPAAGPMIAAGVQPSVSLAVDWKTVRKLPDLQKAYERPASDAGQVAIFGGWLDVLGSTDRLIANLNWPENSTDITLNLTALGVDHDVPLSGFFAQSPEEVLAPLLDPPGTIYSASWFRDYSALWDQRADVLTEEAVAKMEKGDRDIRGQFQVIGAGFTPSELFKKMGTEFRVVLARADKAEYRVELENRLPAAALCVSLRDEKGFLKEAEMVSRAMGLILAFDRQMLTKTTEHAQASLRAFSFRDDDKAAGQGNRIRFNFNPTWTVAREHFIFGSTRDIVAKVIDELDRQAAMPETALASLRVTDRQMLSLTEFSKSLDDFREAILEGTALDRGFTLPDALTEFDLVQDAFTALGRLTTQAAFTEQGFEYEIKLQPQETSGSDLQNRKLKTEN